MSKNDQIQTVSEPKAKKPRKRDPLIAVLGSAAKAKAYREGTFQARESRFSYLMRTRPELASELNYYAELIGPAMAADYVLR